MLYLAAAFGVLAIFLGLFGFRTASRAAGNVAWLFAIVFLVVFVVALVVDRT